MRLDGLHIAPQELPFLDVLDGVYLRIWYFAFCLWVCPEEIKGLDTHTSNSPFPTLTSNLPEIIKLYMQEYDSGPDRKI